jgi:hypothetical protein
MMTVPPIITLIVVDCHFLGLSTMEGSYRGMFLLSWNRVVSNEECCFCDEKDVSEFKKTLVHQDSFCYSLQKHQYMSDEYNLMMQSEYRN